MGRATMKVAKKAMKPNFLGVDSAGEMPAA